MRVAAVLFVLTAACGRVGIDPLATRTDASIGTRDDGGGLIDMAGPDATVVTLADSVQDWALTQGDNGWFYGAWNLTDDPDRSSFDPSTDFEMFTLHPGELWRPADYADTGPTFTWSYLGTTLCHPASAPKERYPIRRWVSSVAGPVSVIVKLWKSDASGGDGVNALVAVDGVIVHDRAIDGTDSVGYEESVPVTLAVGSTVDIMVGFRAYEAIDTSELHATIATR